MNRQTLVYAQFLTEGGEKFKGSASFPIPDDLGGEKIWNSEIQSMYPAILTSSGSPDEIIKNQIIQTASILAFSATFGIPKEEFSKVLKEKTVELCAKFNVSI